jgi:DNA-directed RNA polymerase subunit F
MREIDSFFNDNLEWVNDSGYVDLDGRITGEEWLYTISNAAGMMVGGWATGRIAGGFATWGANMAKNSTNIITKTLGTAIKHTGSLYARSTGNFKNPAGELMFFGHPVTGRWAPTLSHTLTVSVYGMKDMYQNLNQLYREHAQINLQRHKDGKELLDLDNASIFWASAKNAALNMGVSLILSGGVDDDQVTRWRTLLQGDKALTPNLQLTPSFTSYLSGFNIFLNTSGDFLDNFITMYSSQGLAIDKDTGKASMTWDNLKESFTWNSALRTAVQSAFMTFPTLHSNLVRRDIAAENAPAVHSRLLDAMYKKEAEAKNDAERISLISVREQYLSNFKKPLDANGKPLEQPTTADRVFYAASKLDEGLSNLPEGGSSFVRDIIDSELKGSMLGFYQQLHEEAKAVYEKIKSKQAKNQSEMRSKGIGRFIKDGVRNLIGSSDGAIKRYDADKAIGQQFADSLYRQYVLQTGSEKAQTKEERIRARVNFASEILTKAEDDITNYAELEALGDKTLMDKTNEVIASKAEQLGIEAQEVVDSSRFVRLKNETDDRVAYQTSKASLELLVKLMPDMVYKIDDNTYGIMAPYNKIGQMFTTDMHNKIAIAMNIFAGRIKIESPTADKLEALDLIVKMVEGDVEGTRMDSKQLFDLIFQTAIDNKTLTKLEVAEILLAAHEKYSGDESSEIGKRLSEVFKVGLTIKEVTNMDSLSEIEKYAIFYSAIVQLSKGNQSRFSSKTIAAELAKQQDYDGLIKQVMDDMFNAHIPFEDERVKKTFIKQELKTDLFQLATDRFSKDFQDTVEVIGQGGYEKLSNIDPDDEESVAQGEQYLIEALKKLANYKGGDEEAIKARAKDLLDFILKTKEFKPVEFSGDEVQIDLARWQPEGVRKLQKEVVNKDASQVGSMNDKGTFQTNLTETEAEAEFNKHVELETEKTRVIKLTDDNMEAIQWLYNKLLEAKYIDPRYAPMPTNAEDMKKILKTQLSDEAKGFVTYKSGIEYSTDIISAKSAEDIKARIDKMDTNDLVYNVRVLDPTNKNVAVYDYYTMISANIPINNVSEAMAAHMMYNKDAPTYINPIDLSNFEVSEDGVPILIRVDINDKDKGGRAGNQKLGKYEAVETKAQGVDVNKDLAKYFMIESYINYAIETRSLGNIYIPADNLSKAEQLGIIGPEGFYEVTTLHENGYASIKLKDGVTKEDMQYYILSAENPNLFKILPFLSSEAMKDTSRFENPEMDKLDFVPDISAQKVTDNRALYGFLNIMFDYDQKQVLRTDIITGLFNAAKDGSFEYCPFSDMHKSRRIKLSHDEFITYRESKSLREDINDPYQILINSYKQLQSKYINNEKNDDHLLWLKNGNVLKYMIDTARSNGELDVQAVKDMYANYIKANDLVPYSQYGSGYTTISSDRFWGSAFNTDASSYVSKGLVDQIMGITYNLVADDWDPTYDVNEKIQMAYKYVQDHINELDQNRLVSTNLVNNNSNYRFIFEPSDATALWSIFSASGGHVLIDDLDKLRAIEAEAYNEFFEKLGYAKNYGEIIKTKIDALYEQLSKHMVNKLSRQVRLANLQLIAPKTAGSRESISATDFVAKLSLGKNQGAKRIMPELQDIYDYVDRPTIETQSLVDIMGDRIADFAANDYATFVTRTAITDDAKRLEQDSIEVTNDYLKDPVNRYTAMLTQAMAKDLKETNRDPGNRGMIQDISANINLAKMVATAVNTEEALVKELGLDMNNKKVQANLGYFVTSLVRRMSGIRYVGTYAKYTFLDPTTGKEFTNAHITRANGKSTNIDLMLTMFDDKYKDSDFVGKIFINLDKHNADRPEGLTFAYQKFETEADVRNFKNDLILKTLKENEWRLKDIKGTTFFEKLENMGSEQYTSLMNKIISDTITDKDKVDNIIGLLNKTNVQDIWKALVLPEDFILGSNKYTVEELLGYARKAVDSDNAQLRRISKLILYGIEYDFLDSGSRRDVDNARSLLAGSMIDSETLKYRVKDIFEFEQRINKGLPLTDKDIEYYRSLFGIKATQDQPITSEMILEGLKKYIYLHYNNSEVLDYLFNKKTSLNKRLENFKKGFNDTYNVKDIDGTISKLPIAQLTKFFNGERSTLNNVNALDMEGATKNQTNDINDVFQIGIIRYSIEDGKVVETQEEYFIDHQLSITGTNFVNSAEKWIDMKVDYDSSFMKRSEGTRKALEDYKAGNGKFITVSELKALLSKNNPDLFIAYSGDSYEFQLLKPYLPQSSKTLDAIETVLKREGDTTKSIGQEAEYKRTFSEDYEESHTALGDTSDMMDLLKHHFNTRMNIAEDRNKLIADLMRLIPEDFTDVKSVLKQLDNTIFTEDFNEIRNTFKHYSPTLDNIRNLQRAYNHIKNISRGRAWFDVMEQLGYNKPGMVQIIADKNSRNNIADVLAIKSLETDGDPVKALKNMYYKYMEIVDDEEKGSYEFLEKISSKDTDTLLMLGIDLEKLNTSDKTIYNQVQSNRKTVIDLFSQGVQGYKQGKIKGISAAEATNYENSKGFLPYLMSIQSTVLDNKDFFSEDALDHIANMFVSGALTLEEGTDVNKLKEYQDRNVYYNDPGVKALLAELKNVYGKNKGTGSFIGLYSFMNVLDKNNSFIEVDINTNKAIGKLENTTAGDIVLTRNALKKFFNVYDVETMRASDGNYYLMSVTYPADNMNPILPLRVRLIEGNELTVRVTPQTQEILRNRDFDGDHTMTTVLSPDAHRDAQGNMVNNGMLEMAPILYRTMWAPLNVYEGLYSKLLEKSSIGTTNEFEQLKIAMDKDIVNLSMDLDKVLSKAEGKMTLDEFSDELADIKSKINKRVTEICTPEYCAKIGIIGDKERAAFIKETTDTLADPVEMFVGISNPLRYVNNPALYKKQVNNENTLTYKARKAAFSRQLLLSSNLVDPIIGTYQKFLAALDLPTFDITDPMKDLFTPTVYMTKSMTNAIKSDITSLESYKLYVKDLISMMKSEFNSNTYSEDAKERVFKTFLTEFEEWSNELISEDVEFLKDKAVVVTSEALHNMELLTRDQNNLSEDMHKALYNALDIVSKDDTYKNQLKQTEKVDALYNKLSNTTKRISGFKYSDTPLADQLTEEIVNSRLSTAGGKKLNVTTSDKLDEVSDGTFNFAKAMDTLKNSTQRVIEDGLPEHGNTVNIFVTKGMFSTEDPVGFNTNHKKGYNALRGFSASFEDASKGMFKVKTKEGKLRDVVEGDFIPKGYKGAETDMVVAKVLKDDNKILVFKDTGVKGKKLTGLGIFKGIVDECSLYDATSANPFHANNVDLVIDARNVAKNWNKYAQGADFMKYFDNAVEVTYKDSNGKEYVGVVLKDVPVNLIGSDYNYTEHMNPNDPSDLRQFEIMTTPGAMNFLNFARFGSSAIKKNADGTFRFDASEITRAVRSNQGDHTVSWNDVGTNIMYLRTDALLHAMSDEEFLGLMGEHNSTFKSKKDYLMNLISSREKVNSRQSLNEQYALMRLLGRDKMIKLANSSPLTKYLFSDEIAQALDPTITSTFSDDFYANPRSATTSSSGKNELVADDRGAKVIHASNFNESIRSTTNKNLMQNTLLHIPFNTFVRGVTGYYPKAQEIIDGILQGKLGYRTFIPGSASIGTEWLPVDSRMGAELDPILNEFVAGLGQKTILPGDNDAIKVASTTGDLFQAGSGNYNVFESDTNPANPSYNSLAGDTINRGHLSSGFSPEARLGYVLSLIFDPYKSTLEKAAEYKGIKGIGLHKLVGQFVNTDGHLAYQKVSSSEVVNPRDFYSKVNAGTKGYMLRKDITDNVSKHEFVEDEMKAFKESDTRSKEQFKIQEMEILKQKAFEERQELVNRLRQFWSEGSSETKLDLLWESSDKVDEFRTDITTRSGLKIDTSDHLAVDIGLKNSKSEAEYIQFEYGQRLENLNKLIRKSGTGNFEQFAKYRWLNEASKYPDSFDAKLNYLGVSKEEFTSGVSGLKESHDAYVKANPQVVKAYDEFISSMVYLAKRAAEITNEPFGPTYVFMAPYVPRNPEDKAGAVLSNVKNIANISKYYDPVSMKNTLEQNLIFNFSEGSEKIIRDLSNIIASENLHQALRGTYTGKALIDNTSVINKMYEIIDDTNTFAGLKIYNKFDSDVTNAVMDVLTFYTDIDAYRLKKISKDGSKFLMEAYTQVRGKAQALKQQLAEQTSGVIPSLSEVYRMAHSDEGVNQVTKMLAKEVYNAMWAELVISQRIVESSSTANNALVKYVTQLEKDGYCLVNKFGQKIKRGGTIAPMFEGSLSYLKDNIELSYNSKNEAMFAQYVLEKAISGEIYLARNDLADQLDSKYFTRKIPGRVMKLLKKISTSSAGIQMALPAKMVSRLLRYTGTDYAIGAISNLNTIPNIPRAAKELSQAATTQGKVMTDDLKDYLMREGQPSLWGGTNRDPINFTEDMGDGLIGKLTDQLTKPLDFQNHLGRYAIYLTAKESFDKGKPWYGSQYYMKDAIDGIADNRDKAMYIMDYMLGSPGGFPYASKYTSGIMMFATFPMNLTRTFGAYGMSMARLFQEGLTENNSRQWFNTIVMPSVGVIGLSLLSNALLSAVCDAYGISEEKEEEWKKSGVTLDPIGTLIGGTPNVVYDSLNPVQQMKEMYINPLTNEYNDTIAKKGYGWMKANVLSRLNPALKLPYEIVTGEELYGDSGDPYRVADKFLSDTHKYQYTNIENGMRKVLGFLTGTSVANNIIDQNKYAQYSDQDTGFLTSIWKGLTKGINDDLGNQKSWKKDTSNYYAFITDIRAYNNMVNGNGQNFLDIDDMSDADKLYYNRTYSSKYGTFDELDYNRVNTNLKKMINGRESATIVYNYILTEYNNNNVSEATLRAALNNNSIVRKLRTLKTNLQDYINTLTPQEQARLQDAIEYEMNTYPMLEKLFPTDDNSGYMPKYKKTYNSNYYGSGYSRYYPYSNYYPGKYYPKTFSYNKKLDRYGNWDLDRVNVNVSPEMGVWSNDYNLTSHDTGVDYEDRSDLEWLR